MLASTSFDQSVKIWTLQNQQTALLDQEQDEEEAVLNPLLGSEDDTEEDVQEEDEAVEDRGAEGGMSMDHILQYLLGQSQEQENEESDEPDTAQEDVGQPGTLVAPLSGDRDVVDESEIPNPESAESD